MALNASYRTFLLLVYELPRTEIMSTHLYILSTWHIRELKICHCSWAGAIDLKVPKKNG